MRRTFLCLISSAFLCSASQVFSINETVGAGSLTGTIQTDGTIGTLATADILDWNLVLNDGVQTFNLLGPLSGNNSQEIIVGTDLTETATALFYNFSGNGLLAFQAPALGSGQDYVCLNSAAANCDTSPAGISLCITGCSPQPNGNQFTALNGNQQISGTATPEPSTFVLMSVSAGVLVARRRASRRKAKSIPPALTY